MPIAKKLSVLLILLVIINIAFALNSTDYNVSSHTITIQLSSDGVDTVSEKFFISFLNDATKKEFRDVSASLDNLIIEWTKRYPLVTPSFGEKGINKKITYNEGTPGYLQISYDLPTNLMNKIKEATMQTEYALKPDYFNSFYTSNQWVIPDQTIINIELPPGAEIKGEVKPQATITKNGPRTIVSWQGYKNGTELALSYIIWKKIDPVIDLNAITEFLFKTEEGLMLIAALIIILGVIIWQREKIAQIIEEFVEKNSQISEE